MDWGMKNRLSRIINPETGRTVMLAVDHGYFMGPTHKLEEPRKTIEPLLAYSDAICAPVEYSGPLLVQEPTCRSSSEFLAELA